MTARRKIAAAALFVAGFAFVESAVVVYLQKAFLNGAAGAFPLKMIDPRYLRIEIFREAATIVILAGIALMLEKGAWRVFWAFAALFGAWDVLYYAWLHVLIGWPSSFFAWDVLFLIPAPWLAPVAAPVFVALVFIGGAFVMLRRSGAAKLSRIGTAAAAAGLAVILWTFLADSASTMLRGSEALIGFVPGDFHWTAFWLGIALFAGSLAQSFVRFDKR